MSMYMMYMVLGLSPPHMSMYRLGVQRLNVYVHDVYGVTSVAPHMSMYRLGVQRLNVYVHDIYAVIG